MARDIDDEDAEERELPTQERLAAILAELSKRNAEMAETRGHIGAAIKSAEDDHNVHRAAIKLVAKLQKMDETKRAEWFRHFDHYTEVLDIRSQQQYTLFDGDEEDREEAGFH